MLPTIQLFFPIQQMTHLERMVVNRAIGSSVLSNLVSEFSIERTLFDVSHSQNLWVFSVCAILIYGQYKYQEGVNHRKLSNIGLYDKSQKIVRELLVILFLVLTRDVDNAI
jgi:hypothetical protein